MGETYLKVCDVCMLLDKDLTAKECEYCDRCKAFICLKDLHRWDRRARAMTKRAALKATGGCGCGSSHSSSSSVEGNG